MQHTTNNNAADFLLDGMEFFGRIHQSLRNLIANGNVANGQSYVRIAYWMIKSDLYMPGVGGGHPENFLETLRDVALAGFPVQIIAWQGNKLMDVSHDWLIGWVRATNAACQGRPGYRPMSAYSEPYGGDHYACSNHQKISLISINGVKEAFVGGFNMSFSYLSAANHNAANKWHDTAVRVRGPAVDDIETEWLRRWHKQGVNTPQPNTAIVGPQANAGNLTITTCTNDVEAAPAQADIRPLMETRIQNAQNLIYMENYGLTDPFLVQELAGAVRGAHGHNPRVITIVDDPRGAVQAGGLKAFGSYLMYYTFMELSLPNLASIDIIDGFLNRIRGQTRNVLAANMANRRVTKNLIARNEVAVLNPATGYAYQFTELGQAKSISFSDIRGFTPNANANVMYTLSNNAGGGKAYPHSKLAVFDDDWLVVGTSNWTYRSMQYDGEITLFINDAGGAPNFVTAARDRLFGHWNQPNNPANWNATAQQNVVDMANGTIPLGNQAPRVVPLGFNDFIHPASDTAWQPGFTWLGYGGSAIY